MALLAAIQATEAARKAGRPFSELLEPEPEPESSWSDAKRRVMQEADRLAARLTAEAERGA